MAPERPESQIFVFINLSLSPERKGSFSERKVKWFPVNEGSSLEEATPRP
jgi:hypothetical protein